MRAFHVFCLLLGCLVLAGCGSGSSNSRTVAYLPQAAPVNPPEGSQMLTMNTYAADALHNMIISRMSSGSGILVASLVELENFERTSAFGQISSQQIGSRLGQYGFRVLEARLGTTLRMDRKGGEFMLTRDSAKLLADTYDAGAALVGCYSDAGNTVYVSVRVVRLADNAIIGAYEYYLPRAGEVSSLLAVSSTGSGKKDGGDAVWRRYNAREMAFPPERPGTQSTGAKAAASGSGGAEALNSTGGVGKVIDPSAPPTPLPGKRRR